MHVSFVRRVRVSDEMLFFFLFILVESIYKIVHKGEGGCACERVCVCVWNYVSVCNGVGVRVCVT